VSGDDSGADSSAAGAGTAGEEDRAVEAFERLGLTGYEARVFIALHRLGAGTAREVSEVTDVPRSQVYSAAESLADRGLLSVQQSSPMRYRPVSVEAARSTLRERFDRESARAFDYVDRVRETADEQREDIWTVRGREAVTDRVLELLGEADERVLFGTRLPELAPEELVAALEAVAADGVSTTVVSKSETVRDRFDEGVTAVGAPPTLADDDRSGRLLFIDDDVVLLSVTDSVDVEGGAGETAIWSAHSNMATVLIRLAELSLGVDRGE